METDEEVLISLRQIWPDLADAELMTIHHTRKRSTPVSTPMHADPAQPAVAKKAKVAHRQALDLSTGGVTPHVPSPTIAQIVPPPVPSPVSPPDTRGSTGGVSLPVPSSPVSPPDSRASVTPIGTSLKSRVGMTPIKKTKAAAKHKYSIDETMETRAEAAAALCLLSPAKEKNPPASVSSRKMKRSHQEVQTVAKRTLRSTKKPKQVRDNSK